MADRGYGGSRSVHRDYALLVRQKSDECEAELSEPLARADLRLRNESHALGRTTLPLVFAELTTARIIVTPNARTSARCFGRQSCQGWGRGFESLARSSFSQGNLMTSNGPSGRFRRHRCSAPSGCDHGDLRSNAAFRTNREPLTSGRAHPKILQFAFRVPASVSIPDEVHRTSFNHAMDNRHRLLFAAFSPGMIAVAPGKRRSLRRRDRAVAAHDDFRDRSAQNPLAGRRRCGGMRPGAFLPIRVTSVRV